jgi:hypothetical protein
MGEHLHNNHKNYYNQFQVQDKNTMFDLSPYDVVLSAFNFQDSTTTLEDRKLPLDMTFGKEESCYLTESPFHEAEEIKESKTFGKRFLLLPPQPGKEEEEEEEVLNRSEVSVADPAKLNFKFQLEVKVTDKVGIQQKKITKCEISKLPKLTKEQQIILK